MYDRILVPIDDSPTAQRVLAEAAQLAKLAGACVRLLHIVNPVAHTRGFERPQTYLQDILPAVEQAGAALLEQARAQLVAQGVQAETALVQSLDARVAQIVVEQAGQWGADLIVLGTHGRRGVARMLLGSDAEQIARTAPVPVLLVRLPQGSAEGGG